MADRLGLYNGAALILGETRLSSLTESRELRHNMDTVWGNNFVRRVLEQGLWNFAIRTVQGSYDPGVSPNFGYRYAISKPSDWVRTGILSTSEHFDPPLLDYEDKAGYWWTHETSLYLQYVSDDSSYGGDLSLWPESFTSFAEHFFAYRLSHATTASADKVKNMDKLMRRARTEARSNDASGQPVAFAPSGSWVRSRRGGRTGNDRGNRGSLIG